MQLGDKIEVKMPAPKDEGIKPENIEVEILYEDKDIIVVNKPKGLVVHPANRKPRWHTCKCINEHMQRNTIWNWWSH